MEDDDDAAFQQQQIARPWKGECTFCQRSFSRPGSLTAHLNTACGAAKAGLAQKLHQAREHSNALKRAQDDEEHAPTRAKKSRSRWYEDEDLDVDYHPQGGSKMRQVCSVDC
jgi:hypothetical protein